jgi:hypothetical protein
MLLSLANYESLYVIISLSSFLIVFRRAIG